MTALSPDHLAALATACLAEGAIPAPPPRQISIWEITSWILPMAPEHLRRVLAAEPGLPQGTAGSEGGTRWFTQNDLTALRAHFAKGPRKARYQPVRAAGALAPLVALTGPLGNMGRTTCLLHLATAAALSGLRVLVIDGDPAGRLASTLPPPPGQDAAPGTGVLSLIARSAALHLRRLNEARLERGDTPQPMDEALSAALPLRATDLIRPSLWSGLDVMAAPPAMMLGDLQITGWRLALRTWQPGRALAAALDDEGLRQRYDLILCDTPRGLGPLALALLTSADVLLAPFPLQETGPHESGLSRLGAGLQALAQATSQIEAEAQIAARALGQTAPAAQAWQRLWVLPNRAGPDAPRQMAACAAKLGEVLLPNPMPDIAALAQGAAAQFYDLDYRTLGRLAYAPLREACDAAWRAMADGLAKLQQS